jgi:predicted amidohydrolase
MKIRLSAVQCRVGVSDTFRRAERLIKQGVDQNVELFLLPEYFSYEPGKFGNQRSDETQDFLLRCSSEYSCIVAGNVIIDAAGRKGYLNALHIFKDGELIGIQEKLHPTKSERELGILSGHEAKIFDINGIKFSALICADILYPEICRVVGLKGAEIVLNPVISLKRSELPGERLRHCLYFTRSFDNTYAIVKAGGPGYTFLGSETVGRSLISLYDGIPAIYTDENSEELVYAEIDVEGIRKYRQLNYSLTDRNIGAYYEILKY